jgi:hypothetical protein
VHLQIGQRDMLPFADCSFFPYTQQYQIIFFLIVTCSIIHHVLVPCDGNRLEGLSNPPDDNVEQKISTGIIFLILLIVVDATMTIYASESSTELARM